MRTWLLRGMTEEKAYYRYQRHLEDFRLNQAVGRGAREEEKREMREDKWMKRGVSAQEATSGDKSQKRAQGKGREEQPSWTGRRSHRY